MLRRGEGVTIEWTLTGLPTDVVYDQIEIRVSNATGSTTAIAVVTLPLMPVASEPEQSLFVPVILTSAGRNNSFFTSELTLTNRGAEEATLYYTYTAHPGGGRGTATDSLAPGRQRIDPNAIGYVKKLGIPIPDSGNRIGTLRVGVSGSSGVSVVVRTTTAVPDGRAGLSYPAIAEDEGFEEAVYLCGLRQNGQDRSNVAFQNMGTPEEGSITVRTTVLSGEADDTSPQVLGDVTLGPGGFHQYSRLLGVLGSPAQGYVKVEKVEGSAPFYAYGVINDNFNSDGSFVFPVTESSLVGRRGQTLPVIIETGTFNSELTVTNFSASAKTVKFHFVAEAIETDDDDATFSLKLKSGEQRILPHIVNWLRQREDVEGIGPANRAFVGAVFATLAEGDMSGIVIGARTGSPDKRGGQYSLFYNVVPYGSASIESAWIYGLQQNEENRSNLALVNTGEIDESPSTFEIDHLRRQRGYSAEDQERDARCPPLDSGEWDSGQNQSRIRSGEEDFGQQPVCHLRCDQRRRQARRTEWGRRFPAQPGVAASGSPADPASPVRCPPSAPPTPGIVPARCRRSETPPAAGNRSCRRSG